MKDRLGNIERIVTDGGYGLTQEIESLRNSDDTGVPLNVAKREKA